MKPVLRKLNDFFYFPSSGLYLTLLFCIFFTWFSWAQTIIYSENFNSESDTYPLHAPTTGSSSWTATYISGSTGLSTDSRWAVYQPAGTSSKLLEMYVGGTDKIYLVTKACNTVAYDNNLVDASCFSSLTLSYDWAAGGESGNTDDHLVPVYSTDNGVTWTNLGSTLHHNSAAYPALQSVTNLDISSLDGQVFNIGFRWVNDAASGTNNGPLVDNIVIRGVQPACTGTPVVGTITSNYTTGCSGKSVELVLNSNTGITCESGLSYQWQSSANGSTGWTNIGQTNPEMAITTSTSTIYYRLNATCSNSGITSSSNVINYAAVPCTDYLLNAGSNGTTVNTCLGMFYDDGGVSGTYANSQNRTITFCSGTSEHIMIDFFLFETQNNGQYGVNEVRIDILNVFDGINTSAPQMFSLSGGSDPNEGEAPTIISSGSCLTFQFTSNASTVDIGWEAMISCTDEQNNIASNYCSTAPFICNLNGYQGSTTNFYNPNNAGGTLCSSCSDFDGTLDNNSFITFQPTSSTVSFQLEVYNCSGGITSTSGFYEAIQFGVYAQGAGGSCDIGARVSDYYDIYDGIVPGEYTKVLTGLTVGSTYYIIVDGLWGTVCDYRIDVNSGISLPTIDIDEATICSGDNITLTASGGTSYVWSNGSTTPNTIVSTAGVYEVIVSSGNPLCPDNTVLNSIIVVDNCALPVELSGFKAECAGLDEVIVSWTTASEHNSSHFNLEKSIDGINWELIETIGAAGNTTSTITYSYTDSEVRGLSTVYYRLKQVDLNGEVEIHQAISAACLKTGTDFYIYPNPSTGIVTVFFNESFRNSEISIHFYDINGKEVKRVITSGASNKSVFLDLFDLEAGIYFIRLLEDDFNKSLKFVKL